MDIFDIKCLRRVLGVNFIIGRDNNSVLKESCDSRMSLLNQLDQRTHGEDGRRESHQGNIRRRGGSCQRVCGGTTR